MQWTQKFCAHLFLVPIHKENYSTIESKKRGSQISCILIIPFYEKGLFKNAINIYIYIFSVSVWSCETNKMETRRGRRNSNVIWRLD